MLGTLFGVGQQVFLGSQVGLGRGGAGAGAGQGADGGFDSRRERRWAAPSRESPLGGQRPAFGGGAWGQCLLAHQNFG